MQKFGKMWIATYRDNSSQAKLANIGIPDILVGYADCHPTYQVFNPKTKKIILTLDMIFLQKLYSKYSKVEKPVLVTTNHEGLDDEEELKRVLE